MRKILLSVLLIFPFQFIFSQPDDLAKMLEEELASESTTDYATASFKTTRLVNAHTNENVGRGVMDMRISHRFGPMNSGIKNFFGLDQATMRVALEYGLTDWLMIGGGRSTYEKTYDSFLKAKILRQSTGKRKMPISVSYLSAIQTKTIPFPDQDRTNFFTSNMFFVNQIIIARKFSEGVSIMISPTVVHRNLVPTVNDPHDLFSIVMGGRVKITKRMSVNLEYIYQLPDTKPAESVNSLSIGFDLETGGHVFQFAFTNSQAQIEKAFIHETRGSWSAGDIISGFNLSRVFTLKDPRSKNKEAKKEW
ncbi:MAG: DUF5777 family beta-barrel protein [Bacteroidia bacterium]